MVQYVRISTLNDRSVLLTPTQYKYDTFGHNNIPYLLLIDNDLDVDTSFVMLIQYIPITLYVGPIICKYRSISIHQFNSPLLDPIIVVTFISYLFYTWVAIVTISL